MCSACECMSACLWGMPSIIYSPSCHVKFLFVHKNAHLKLHKINTVYLYRAGFILILLLLDTQIMELSLVFSYLCKIGAFFIYSISTPVVVFPPLHPLTVYRRTPQKPECDSNSTHSLVSLENTTLYVTTVTANCSWWDSDGGSRKGLEGQTAVGKSAHARSLRSSKNTLLQHPFCLRHARPHQSKDRLDNKPSPLP